MQISVGEKLPTATLLERTTDTNDKVALADRLKGRNVVIFGLPGAFTGTCSSAHVPSFIRTAADFADKGVDEIICVSVNDPFVMQAWGVSTGATEAGISMLADASGEFTKAIGMDFNAPDAGLHGRSKRYALYAVDGVIKLFNPEASPGVCETSAGETLLDQI